MAMTFLTCVNRILQSNGLIRGDTDTLASFSDTSHNSTSSIAQIAVQLEIAELTSRGLLPYEHKIQQVITLLNGTRTYSLPTDFDILSGDPPFFLDTVQNYRIIEYPGGENQLSLDTVSYRTQSGAPQWFYFEKSTTMKVSFYPVPDSSVNNRVLNYDYEASVNVSLSTDTIPLAQTDQQYAFTNMASRRFKFLYEGKVDIPVDRDPIYVSSRAVLMALLTGKQATSRYGAVYK